MGIGNRRKAIRTVLYRGTPEDTEFLRDIGGDISRGDLERDKLRHGTDLLWTSIDGNFVYNEHDTVHAEALSGRSTEIYSLFYEEEVFEDSDSLFPITSQIIRIRPNTENIFLYNSSGDFQLSEWERVVGELRDGVLPPERFVGSTGNPTLGIEGIETLPTDRVDSFGRVFRRDLNPPVFYDSTFEYNTPYQYEEASGIDFNDVVTLVGDVRPEYNFYVRSYEESLSLDLEVEFPCLYNFISERESDYTDEDNSVYNQHISLNGRIRGVFKDITNKRGERIGERDVGVADYFDSWASGIRQKRAEQDNPSQNRELVRSDKLLFEKYKNMVFAQSDVDFLNTMAEQKESFPMTNEIRFSTGVATQTSDVLKDSNLFADLVAYALTAEAGSIAYAERGTTGAISRQEYSVIDLSDWWTSIGTPRVVNDAVVFGRNKTSETDILNSDVMTGPMGNLLKVIFLGKIRNLIGEHSRTLQQAFRDGEVAHSETLVYEIEKYKIEDTGQSSLQKIFIPNSSDLDLCRFIDTQVQYDTEYQYRIFVHQIVYGMKYSYYPEESSEMLLTPSGDVVSSGWATVDAIRENSLSVEIPRFRVEMQPHLELIRAPYFTSEVIRILDKPPVAPDVDFIPYKGVPDRILMNLNAGTGDYHLIPQIIEQRELREIKLLRAAQGVGPKDPINYVSDDPPQEFQIFRLAQKPTSYQDFSDNLLTTISTLDGLENLAAGSFVDGVIPNRKYYYTFRVMDVHDQTSFPSPIYQIEMVEEDGAVYLLVDVLDLEEERIRKNSMAMNNLIYIKPSLQHGRVNFDETNYRAGGVVSANELERNDIVMGLGPDDEGLWNKRFKFRFISKSSGKKFDVNARFRYIFNVEKDKERKRRNKKGAQKRRAANPFDNIEAIENEHYDTVIRPTGMVTTEPDTSAFED